MSKQRINQMQAFAFEPLGDKIGNHVVVGTPGKPSDSSSMKNTAKKKKIVRTFYKEYSDYLEDIKLLYNAALLQQNQNRKINMEKEKHQLYPSPRSSTIKIITKKQLYPLIYLNRKSKRLNFNKLKKIKEITEEALNELQNFDKFLTTFMENNIPMNIDTDSIKKAYDQYLYSNPDIKTINFKIIAIQTRISFLKQRIKNHRVKYERPNIINCLRLCSIPPSKKRNEESKNNPKQQQQIDDSNLKEEDLRFKENMKMGYREYCEFDDLLEAIIPSSEFDGLATQINQGNFNIFNEYFDTLCQSFHLQPVKKGSSNYNLINNMLMTLKSSLSRIVFAHFYVLSPILDIYLHKILVNSEKLVQCTPKQFSIIKNVFKDQSYYDVPIQYLFGPEPILIDSNETDVISSTCHESRSIKSNDSSSLGPKRKPSLPSSVLESSLLQNSLKSSQTKDPTSSARNDDDEPANISKKKAFSDDDDFVFSLRYDSTDSSSGSEWENGTNPQEKKQFDIADLDSIPDSFTIPQTLHPFGDIAQPEIMASLETAFQLIHSLPFLVDPFDIVNSLSMFLNEMTKIISKAEQSSQFNFDDFFAFYVIFMAKFIPENARGISAFMTLVSTAKLNKAQEQKQSKKLFSKSPRNTIIVIQNSFTAEYSHAISIFNAALDYLQDFKPEDLPLQ